MIPMPTFSFTYCQHKTQIRDEAFESSTMSKVASPVGLFKCSALSSDYVLRNRCKDGFHSWEYNV